MKNWKRVFYITLAILIVFLIYVGFLAWNCYSVNLTYPRPAMGVDINNWIEYFVMELWVRLIVFGVPLLIDVVLLIKSIVKIKGWENYNAIYMIKAIVSGIARIYVFKNRNWSIRKE